MKRYLSYVVAELRDMLMACLWVLVFVAFLGTVFGLIGVAGLYGGPIGVALMMAALYILGRAAQRYRDDKQQSERGKSMRIAGGVSH